jgi:CheY-like chemotaxis protein
MTSDSFDPDLVLVVDDISENIELARVYLKKLGWRVLTSDSGEHALRTLGTVTPAWILLDIKMPGIDGLALAKILRSVRRYDNSRIVGYTAHALKDEVINILASGFDSVLIKPITYADISDSFGANVQVM